MRGSLLVAVTCLFVACSREQPAPTRASSVQSRSGAPSPANSAGTLATPPAAAGAAATDGPLIVSVAGASGSPAADGCTDAAKLIYVVDQDGRFSSFNPGTTPPVFKDITASLGCPAQPGFLGLVKPTPYSMSVDRNAVAWVLYSSGELFKVDTARGVCTATAFQSNQSGFQLMGMGFVANAPMSPLDTLYVAGGAGPDSGAASRLGTVDMGSLRLMAAGQLSGWPELTGTGLAELWGFYPDTSPPKIAKLDKASGAESKVYPLAALQGEPAAWAFAFWGGDFWVFLQRTTDSDTTVYRVNGSTGALTPVLTKTGRSIVGAGVSTCAPVQLL